MAQEGLHIGFAILPQSTWITNLKDTDDSWSNYTSKFTWGYAGLAKLGYNIGPPLGFHINVLYSKQGQSHFSDDPSGNRHEIHRELTYLKVPFFVAVSSDEGGGRNAQKAIFCFGGGPMYAMIMDAKITDNGAEKHPGVNVMDMFKASHWGGAWYVGADFRLGGDIVFLNTRIQGDHSAGTIENRDFLLNGTKFYADSRPKTNNFNLGITLGITFVIPTEGGGGRRTGWWR